MITDGTVSSADIANSTITVSDIANNAVTSAKILDSTITSDDLDNDSVSSSEIADDSVGRSEISGDGSANLPIAYGYCNSNGTTRTDYSTTNVSCSWSGSRYVIDITGESFFYNEYVTIVTPTSDFYIPRVRSSLGNVSIGWIDDDGITDRQTDFSFVIYKR